MRNEPVGKLVGSQGRAIRLRIGKASDKFGREIEHLLVVIVINIDKVRSRTRPLPGAQLRQEKSDSRVTSKYAVEGGPQHRQSKQTRPLSNAGGRRKEPEPKIRAEPRSSGGVPRNEISGERGDASETSGQVYAIALKSRELLQMFPDQPAQHCRRRPQPDT